MSSFLPVQGVPLVSQLAYDATLHRLIVTVSVVAFAICDWTLYILLRDGPWGSPMRLVLGTEAVTEAVNRTLDAVLLWPTSASVVQLKAGWQEQQIYVWNSGEQGAAVSLLHTVLLRANRQQLRPHLLHHPIPSLRVAWVPVADIESGQRELDPDVLSSLKMTLQTLRLYIQNEPELVLRYLADMGNMASTLAVHTSTAWQEDRNFSIEKEPTTGDGSLTLAEATLLYRAFFPPEEQVDLSNLRKRFLATNTLELMSDERPVRGKEMDWRRVSRTYRYLG